MLKIKDLTLDLNNYQLNAGVCMAVTQALSAYTGYAENFILNQNGLKDENFAILLKGMSYCKKLKILSYQNNPFSFKSF